MGGKKTSDRTKVLEFIKASKVPVGKAEIIKATGFDGDFSWCMHSLMNENEEIEKYGTKRLTTYLWKPKKPLYSEMKNHEGYPDPTAGKALRNVMKSDGKWHRKLEFGEVYSCKDSKSIEGILIISSKVGTVIGLNVYSKREDFIKDGYFIDWSDKKGTHYVSTISIVNIPEWKIKDKISEIPAEKKSSLMDHIRFVMDLSIPVINFDPVEPKEIIKEVPVEVIKEVPVEVTKEVQVEVPVEVIKEVEVVKPVEIHAEAKEIELAVLKAKCEIYEKLVFGGIVVPQKLQAV